MEPLTRLSEPSVILDYLKKHCLTEDIEESILRKISEVFANRLFNPVEVQNDIENLKLSIDVASIIKIRYTLQCCASGQVPKISRKTKHIFKKQEERKEKFSSIEELLGGVKALKIEDYRKEVPIIKERIIQEQNQNWLKYDEKVKEYGEESAKASYDGPLPEYPAKPLPNFLGIISPELWEDHLKYPLIEVKKSSYKDIEIAIKTGDLIYAILKKDQLEAFYFNGYKKIIVLSSSNVSREELRLKFEKFNFNTGMYPVVEEERTQFGDLIIHFSDKLPPLIQPLSLPSESEILDYLRKDNLAKWYFKDDVFQLIAKKLNKAKYVPEETLNDFNTTNSSLNPWEMSILDKVLLNCAKKAKPSF